MRTIARAACDRDRFTSSRVTVAVSISAGDALVDQPRVGSALRVALRLLERTVDRPHQLGGGGFA